VKTIAATNLDNTSVTRTGGQMRTLFGLKSSFVTAIDGNVGVQVNTPAPPENAPVSPEVMASERSVLISTKPTATQPAGKPFAVKAKVTPSKKGFKTWLQQQVNGEWKTIAKKKTAKKGRVSYRVKEAWPPSSTLLYRVVTVKKKAIVGASTELSVGVVSSVKPRTVALVTDSAVTVASDKGLTISAIVRPKKKGLIVWRQVLASGDPETGEWKTEDTKRTAKKGRVSFRIKKSPQAGVTSTYRLVVVDNRQAAGVSPLVSVTVTG
jgi:hypothetical protein